jgi:hypothetical protein
MLRRGRRLKEERRSSSSAKPKPPLIDWSIPRKELQFPISAPFFGRRMNQEVIRMHQNAGQGLIRWKRSHRSNITSHKATRSPQSRPGSRKGQAIFYQSVVRSQIVQPYQLTLKWTNEGPTKDQEARFQAQRTYPRRSSCRWR